MIQYPGRIAFTLLMGLGLGARAQSADPGSTAAAAPTPAPETPASASASAPAAAAPVAAPAPPVEAVSASRIDDLEQLARITARKQELLDEELAKRAKESPVVTAEDKGFSLRLPDNAYVLKIGALLQADGRFFLHNDALEANDTFLIRRFRPIVDGTLFSIADFRLVPDFAGGTLQVMDGYLDLHPYEWARLRFGKYKGTIGLERLQADADVPLLERALDQNLSSTREIGVQLWGNVGGGALLYAAGVVNGAPDNTNPDVDTDHAKDVQGRLFFQPFRAAGRKDLGSLGFGVSASTGNRKGRLPVSVTGLVIPTTPAVTGLGSYKTAGQNTFFSYYAPATDTTGAQTTFAHERASHLDPQLYYYFGPFGLLAEYVWSRQGVQRGNSTATLTNQATHATASWVFNGREGFDGATPDVGFDPARGAWGAVEISGRVEWLKIDPATFGDPNVPGSTAYANPAASARSAFAFAGGVAWVPRRSVHLGLNFEQTRFKGGAGTAAAVTDRATENLLLGRAQVSF